MTQSKPFSLKGTFDKFVTGAIIVLLGSLATYLEDFVLGVDFGALEGLVFALNTILVSTIRNYVREIN